MRADTPFQLCIGLVCLISLLGSGLHWLGSESGWDARELYYFLLSLSVTGTWIWALGREREEVRIDRRSLGWAAGLFICALICNAWISRNYSFWFDEWLTFTKSNLTHGPVSRGIDNFQPPFFYALAAVVERFFPLNDWAIRSPVQLFSALAVCLAFLCARQSRAPFWFCVCTTLLLYFNPTFLKYSFEFRPYMIATCLCFCFLHFYGKKNSPLMATISLLLCLLSLGMQSILIASEALALVILATLMGERSRSRRQRIVGIAAAIILYAPFAFWVYQLSPQIFRAASSDPKGEIFRTLFRSILSFESFSFLKPWPEILLALTLWVCWRSYQSRMRLRPDSLFFLLLAMAFCLTLTPFYHGFVDFWELADRYLILGLPLCFVAIHWISSDCEMETQRIKSAILASVCLALVFFSGHQITWFGPNYRPYYEFLSARMREGDGLVVLSDPGCDQWATFDLVGAPLYLGPRLSRQLGSASLATLANLRVRPLRRLFIIFFDPNSPDEKVLSESKFEGFSLLLRRSEGALYEVDLSRIPLPRFYSRLSSLIGKPEEPIPFYIGFLADDRSVSQSSSERSSRLSSISSCRVYYEIQESMSGW